LWKSICGHNSAYFKFPEGFPRDPLKSFHNFFPAMC
jgi:hypothetical protein